MSQYSHEHPEQYAGYAIPDCTISDFTMADGGACEHEQTESLSVCCGAIQRADGCCAACGDHADFENICCGCDQEVVK